MVSSIRMIRTLKLSLWLPIGVVVLSVIRFGFDPSFSTGFVPMLFSLPAVWRRWAAASKARQGFRDIGPGSTLLHGSGRKRN